MSDSAADETEAPAKKRRISGATLLRLLAWLAIPVATMAGPVLSGKPVFSYAAGHLAWPLIPLIPVFACIAYVMVHRNRVSPPARKGRAAPPPRPGLLPLRQAIKDIIDLTAALDIKSWRIAGAASFVVGVALASWAPITADSFKGVADNPDNIRPILLGLIGPFLAYGLILGRAKSIMGRRQASLSQIWTVARDTLGYPKTVTRNSTGHERRLAAPHLAIEVKRWRGLFDVEEFFVNAPEGLSVDDMKSWDAFDTNLNAKVYRDESWRVQRDPRGRGALVTPANYPTAILWDGEVDPDPLTFYLGLNLETGEQQTITLGDTSPHACVSGGTASGKTSMAEIVAAQVLCKPMPWDPTLRGQVHIVDPKGPFARRWRGRPGVVCSNGNEDGIEVNPSTGMPMTGPGVMAAHMKWIEEEHVRRSQVLAKYPDAGTWVHLPDEVKKAERFAPMLVILDEYIDHTDIEKANGDERIEAENDARNTVTRLASWHARKYRNVGMHTILIAQRVNMTIIGNVLMGNLPVRVITGQMDDAQTRTMFQTEEVPSLPSTRVVVENGERRTKTIPGRARIMNALGQSIHKMQIMWFGGKTNSDTLDKHLPRGVVPLNGDFRLPQDIPADEDPSVIAPLAAPRALREDDDEEFVEDDGTLIPAPLGRPRIADAGAILTGGGVTPHYLAEDDDEDEDFRALIAAGEAAGVSGRDAAYDADIEVLHCHVTGCLATQEKVCGTCGNHICATHYVNSPVDGEPKVCLDCEERHPLRRYNMLDAYNELAAWAKEARMGITLTEGADTLTAVVKGAKGNPVAALRSHDNGTITGKTASGEGPWRSKKADVEIAVTRGVRT